MNFSKWQNLKLEKPKFFVTANVSTPSRDADGDDVRRCDAELLPTSVTATTFVTDDVDGERHRCAAVDV
jgi:hypothetical protein